MTKKVDIVVAQKTVKRAAQIGFILAILCHLLPPDYRVVCEAITKVCTGGL